MEKYDNEICKAWNGELDTILVFVCQLFRSITINKTKMLFRPVCSPLL